MPALTRQLVCYMPDDDEAATGGGSSGDEWAAMVCTDGETPNLCVFQADGTTLPKTAVAEGTEKGEWKFQTLGLST